ncbi:unnamed protein product [Owenia fusiformis]|uniref:Uncharacterized protein n=1 Tax=Owenia fusiformis TaxID=6347 RepID=A0A8J1T7E3_OWEFU|nr:unnamed protein product [Owenia fusiformis]
MTETNKPDAYISEKQDLEKADEANIGADLDSSKVKFINGGAGDHDSSVQIEPSDSSESSFSGMSKEELLKFADDPFWVKTRYALFILFWLAWIGMTVAAILIIVFAPKCPPRENLDWWQKGVGYQCYAKSFKDSDGDGVGDLKGVQEKAAHLKSINASFVYLSPVYASPMEDGGYDITNHTEIDVTFGSMADFKTMLSALQAAGLRVIMDFVPNHTSRKHPWFVASQKGKNNSYSDYYIWSDNIPNNWLSVHDGPAWTFDATRNQYYYHQFSADQPDLNLRNEKVLKELEDILKFWLMKGVDGFRVSAAKHLYESADLTADEPVAGNAGSEKYESLEHTLTTHQPETFELMAKWRSLLDGYTGEGRYRVLMAEVYDRPELVAKYYKGLNDTKGADMPFNYNLVELKSGCGGTCVQQLVDAWVDNAPEGRWNNWVVGTHNNKRVASRKGEKYIDAVNMLLMTLPGTPFIYYGDEIGMTDVAIAKPVDKLGRDGSRTPMQWNGDRFAGFTKGNTTWLPVADNYRRVNVMTSKSVGAGRSHMEVFTDLTRLRQEPSFQWGKFAYALVNDEIISYARQAEGFPGFLTVMNLGDKPATFQLKRHLPAGVPVDAEVATRSEMFDNSDFNHGHTVKFTESMHIEPGQGIVFKWPWTPPQ